MRGGKRKNAGRKPGKKNATTLERDAVMAAYRQRVMTVADRLLDIQMGLAKGSTYLFKIEKDLIIGPKGGKTYKAKKPELVTDIEEIQMYLEGMVDEGEIDDPNDPGATYYYMTTKDPDRQAVKDMFENTFGRPSTPIEFEDKTPKRKVQAFNEKQIRQLASRVISAGKSLVS